MVLFAILLLMLLFLTAFIVLIAGAGGAMFTVLFSDVIVCIFIIVWIIKKLANRRK
jgi:hypothetical protein